MRTNKLLYNLIFFLLTLTSCSKQSDNTGMDIDEVLILTNNTQKAWDVLSFKINNIENVDSLKADTCYQPIWLVSDDNYTMYGYNNWLGCIIHGDWFLEENNSVISFNFDKTGYIGIGPWSGGKFTKWYIRSISENLLKIEMYYFNDNSEFK